MGELLGRAALAVLVAAVIGFTAIGLARRSRTFILVAVVVAATPVVIRSGFPGDVPAPWWSVIRYGLVAATLALLWVALVQEPVWLARRLGFIRRSPEWEYDVVLSGLRRDFYRKERAAVDLDIAAHKGGEAPPAAEREALRAEAERILARLRSTPTPSEDWAELATECAGLFELSLEHFGVPITVEVEREFLERDARATAKRDQLVEDYRAKARFNFRWP